ncbi:MAG: class B sortase [Tissierellia bacterium]|nr:class B sortase [Tissierellia bacterium]
MMKNSNKARVRNFTIIVLILIILFSGWMLFRELLEYSESRKMYTEVAENAVIKAPLKLENQISDSDTDSIGTCEAEISVDFNHLESVNPDIIAWIRREDGKLNYPIVQSEDNNYYLYRSVDKRNNKCGSIFMDAVNNADFSDDITLIYGHNMNDGSMFASLKGYEDKDKVGFLPEIRIFTPNNVFAFEVKYVYLHSGSTAISTNFSDEEWEKYISSIEAKSMYVSSKRPLRGEKLVALITCEYAFENARLVVLGTIDKQY